MFEKTFSKWISGCTRALRPVSEGFQPDGGPEGLFQVGFQADFGRFRADFGRFSGFQGVFQAGSGGFSGCFRVGFRVGFRGVEKSTLGSKFWGRVLKTKVVEVAECCRTPKLRGSELPWLRRYGLTLFSENARTESRFRWGFRVDVISIIFRGSHFQKFSYRFKMDFDPKSTENHQKSLINRRKWM